MRALTAVAAAAALRALCRASSDAAAGNARIRKFSPSGGRMSLPSAKRRTLAGVRWRPVIAGHRFPRGAGTRTPGASAVDDAPGCSLGHSCKPPSAWKAGHKNPLTLATPSPILRLPHRSIDGGYRQMVCRFPTGCSQTSQAEFDGRTASTEIKGPNAMPDSMAFLFSALRKQHLSGNS